MTKKSEPKTAPAPEREPLPMEMDVRIHSFNTSGKVLANASVTLGGCFAVRNLRIVEGAKGLFVAMPSYQTDEGLKDVCFPCTKEFRQQFQDTVLAAYRQELARLHEPHLCAPPAAGVLQLRGALRARPAGDPEEAPPDGPEEDGPSLDGMTMQ